MTCILLSTFNWVLERGEIPASWEEAFISVIPKEGKDKLECANYRPIRVLNLDYKLFSSIISKRLEKIILIMYFDQTGFVQACQTYDNFRKSFQVI